MSDSLPILPDFKHIREFLDSERKTIIRVNGIADEEIVRVVEDATVILDFLEELCTEIFKFFDKNGNLLFLFEKEFIELSELFSRNFILDACFLEDCLFPEKETYFFGPDGSVSVDVLGIHINSFKKWMEETEALHNETREKLKNDFNENLKIENLSCRCRSCVAEYRGALREHIFNRSLERIESGKVEILQLIEEKGIREVANAFRDMKRDVDKSIFQARHHLKRSTINRLETQLKGVFKEDFAFPCELATKYIKVVKPRLLYFLNEEGYSEDLISQDELERFYKQVQINLWRNEKFLLNEFKKFARSIMFLKRKDISSTILNEYLGEFWVHSQARQIKRKIIYHMGPTNSGKTYHAIQALCEAGTGCYLAPLRLLAGELYDTMRQKGIGTTLLTGEEVIESEDATHISSTIEMARFHQIFDCAVIDEIQMITDSQRGWAWTRALVNIFAPEVHICGDHSVLELIEKIVELCGDELEIKRYERMTKLEVAKKPIGLRQLEPSDALIVFSRRNALRFKSELEREGHKVSIVYGRLSPEVRREQARKFDEKETDIIVSTDAIAMGMNLPIKRIIFSTLSKYINSQEYEISDSEIKQIAGRAGRFQRFPVGHVSCLPRVEGGLERIEEALEVELPQSKKCMVGPDLDIFNQVNTALGNNNLPMLKLSEFLRLFYTMNFKKPFFCVELAEMIELAETVEEADRNDYLSHAEIFGFACAPVNFGLIEHVQYFVWILNNYVLDKDIKNEVIDYQSTDIDYLETSIKCVELYQWLARHFNNKNFEFAESELLHNKSLAIEQLNDLLSDRMIPLYKNTPRRPRGKNFQPGGQKNRSGGRSSPSSSTPSRKGQKGNKGGRKKYSVKRRSNSKSGPGSKRTGGKGKFGSKR